MYLRQVVPAPQGWTLHGDPVPGEEIYYARNDGGAQVFPHPDHGWELQFNGSARTIRVASPQAAFEIAGV